MLARALELQPGEGRLLLRLGGHLFLMLLATTVYVAVAETSFLAVHPARLLPWTYLVGAGASLLLTLGYGQLRQRLAPRALTRAVTGALAASLIVLWILLDRWPVAGAFMLQVGATGVTVLVGLESAEWIARTLDTRVARRLYPAIGGLGGIGATLGALSVAWLSAHVPVRHLLALSLLASLAAGPLVSRLRVEPRAKRRIEPAAWSSVLAPGFPRTLLLLTFLGAMIAITARQQMLTVLQATLSGVERARFLGLLYGALNAVSIVFGVLLARPLLKRLGVSSALAVYPLLIVLLSVASLAAPVLAVAALTLSCERLFRQNLQRPLLNIAVLPLAPPVAARTTLALRGAIENPAVALASLAMLVVPDALRRTVLGGGLLASGLFALLLALRARSGYARELVEALRARRLRVESGEGPPLPLEAGVRRLLHEQLRSESSDRVRLALDLLGPHADAAACAEVLAHWGHWPTALRAHAVRSLSLSEDPAARTCLDTLADLAGEDSDVALDVELARAWNCAVPRSRLLRWAREPAGPRAAAALVRLASEDGGAATDATLAAWLTQDDEQARAAAAVVIASARPPAFVDRLPGVADAAPEEVLTALAASPLPGMAPWLAARLADDAHEPLARRALERLGAQALPVLAQAARDPVRSVAALDVLLALGLRPAQDVVLDQLDAEDPEQRYRAARALERCGRPPDPRDRERLEAALERELSAGEHAAREEAEAPEHARTEARAAADDALGRALALLAALHPGGPLRRIVLALRGEADAERAFAVEALDELVPAPWRERLVALAERASPGARAARPTPETPGPDVAAQPPAALLQRCEPFRRWRRADLEDVLALSAQAQESGPSFLVGPSGVEGLEAALLDAGAAPVPRAPVRRIALACVWAVIARRPRAAGAWLAGLASRLPAPSPGSADVSLSMPSLAQRQPEPAPQGEDDQAVLARMFHLRLATPFGELSTPRLRLLAEIARDVPVRAGEKVVREGQRGGHAYVVVRGSVQVATGGRVVATLAPGEAFGVLALLSGDPRLASVVAREDGELLALDRLDVRDLLEAHPELVRSFSLWIAARVRSAALSLPGGPGPAPGIKRPAADGSLEG